MGDSVWEEEVKKIHPTPWVTCRGWEEQGERWLGFTELVLHVTGISSETLTELSFIFSHAPEPALWQEMQGTQYHDYLGLRNVLLRQLIRAGIMREPSHTFANKLERIWCYGTCTGNPSRETWAVTIGIYPYTGIYHLCKYLFSLRIPSPIELVRRGLLL